MKKIAILSPGRLPVPAVQGGAVETLLTYIIDENERNHEFNIDLYTIYDDKFKNINYKYTNIISIKNYFIFRAFFKLLNILLSFFNINRLFNYFAINAIKIMNKKGNIYNKIIIENNLLIYDELYHKYKYFKNVENFFHIHNVIYKKDEKQVKYLFKMIANNSKKVIAVSNYMKDYFELKGGKNNIDVLYNCVDFNVYNRKLNDNKNEYRAKLDIPKKSFNFVFTGRCVEDKGVLELLNAFHKLNKKYNDTSLTICGIHLSKPNKFEKGIIKLSKKYNTKLCNYTTSNNLAKIIAASDCVVIPSKCEEAFGVVALEAMAMNKSIISTNSGGLIEPLNKFCAIIIDRNNIEDNIYNAMEKIYLDKTFSNKIANNAFNRVRNCKEFDKKNYYENFINIIS